MFRQHVLQGEGVHEEGWIAELDRVCSVSEKLNMFRNRMNHWKICPSSCDLWVYTEIK